MQSNVRKRARISLKISEEKKNCGRLISLRGGQCEEANKYYKIMKSCGFEPSETIEVSVKASFEVRGGLRPTGRHRG
jgi:pentatricopeptide repeat protein